MSDPRFARLHTDPRFRKPKKTQSKVVVDQRFKSLFADDKKAKKSKHAGGRVDKYGRNVSATKGRDDLKRFYRLDGKEESVGAPSRLDYARGEGLVESSSEDEDEDELKVGTPNDEEDDDDADIVLRRHTVKSSVLKELDELEVDLNEDDGDAFADLDAQAAAYTRDHPDTQPTAAEGSRTRRVAVVNLDWDHVRAIHLYKIFSSLMPRTTSSTSTNGVGRGHVVNVRVYPSEFGKARMKKEEVEGPPKELFQKHRDDEGALVADEGNEYDEDALRKYQLERLRYYYAIVTCDSAETASHIMNEADGTELERTANVLDLSFVPDDMEFDDEFRDEATPSTQMDGLAFKGLDFSTDALRHSKVKLRWDDDDPEREKVTRKALSKKDIEEGNFNALVVGSSSESSDEEDSNVPKEKNGTKKNERDKLRSLLLNGNDDDLPEGWGGDAFNGGNDDGVGDDNLEITFMPALSSRNTGNSDDETTLDKYKKKQKEKRKKRMEEWKEKAKAKANGKNADEGAAELKDDFFGEDSASEKDEQPRRREATREELELLAAPDDEFANVKHFDMNAIVKAEKVKGKKKEEGKKGKRKSGEDDGEDVTQDGFTLDVTDSRFKAMHEDPKFSIDPSNPHFKKTKGMSAILDERAKRKRGSSRGEDSHRSDTSKGASQSLQSLVESVKRKSTQTEQKGQGKRRKL